jgi:hypothetical protein
MPSSAEGGVQQQRPVLDRIDTDLTEADPYGGVESPDVEQRQGPTIRVSSPKADHGQLLDEFPQTPKQFDPQMSAQAPPPVPVEPSPAQAPSAQAQPRPNSLSSDVRSRRTSSLIASRGENYLILFSFSISNSLVRSTNARIDVDAELFMALGEVLGSDKKGPGSL